jgi:hypothetical protein
MTSLGFNTMRQPFMTNLPGAVGASIVAATPVRRSRSRSLSTAPLAPGRAVGASSARIVLTPPVAPPAAARKAAPAPFAAPPAPSERELEEVHISAQWVFGTATCDVHDVDTDEVVATANERVLLVYPMATDAQSGRVRMRLKRVHPVTAQLSHHWVIVYDPEDARVMRPFKHFSLTA